MDGFEGLLPAGPSASTILSQFETPASPNYPSTLFIQAAKLLALGMTVADCISSLSSSSEVSLPMASPLSSLVRGLRVLSLLYLRNPKWKAQVHSGLIWMSYASKERRGIMLEECADPTSLQPPSNARARCLSLAVYSEHRSHMEILRNCSRRWSNRNPGVDRI